VAFLFKARNVEPEKQPLLSNARINSRGVVTVRDAYSCCYVAPAAYACAVTSRSNRRGVASGVLCGPLRGYMTRPTEFSSGSECSVVEGAVVEC
jgi:hypothetical protein